VDTIATTIIIAIPNFAGFVLLAVSNNRTINRLFSALQHSTDQATSASQQRIVALEAKVQVLENLIGRLLEAFNAYPPDEIEGKTEERQNTG